MFSQSSLVSYSKIPLRNLTPLETELNSIKLDFSPLTVEKLQHYTALIEQYYQATFNQIASLAATPEKINFSTVIQPLVDLRIIYQNAFTLCDFTKHVHTDEKLREASTKATKDIERIKIECEQRQDTFTVMQMYHKGSYNFEKTQLHPEQNRYFANVMREYKRNGLFIADSAKKVEVTKIKQEMADLCIQFQKNVADVQTSFVFNAAELKGLSEKFLKDHEIGKDQYKVTLKYPDYYPVMQYAANRNTRKQMFTAYATRCEKENLPILKRVLELRQMQAELLGYATHADYVSEPRIVKKAQVARDFLADMDERFTPVIEKNLHALTQFAKKLETDSNFALQLHDMPYYTRLREEALCNVNMEEIKKYFPLNKVIEGTLKIYQNLLGLKFVPKSNTQSWHADVVCFDVYNQKDEQCKNLIGSFSLDLYPRDNKYAHAAAFDHVLGCDISHLTGVIGDRRENVAAMVCNFPKQDNLPFDQVVVFFHEFGHVMHTLCTKAKLGLLSDFIERDFVEAPSQMLENWCFEIPALNILSSHVDTGKPLPAEIAAKLKDKDKIHAGYFYKRQLSFGIFDMAVHSMSQEEISKLDLKAFYQQVQTHVMGMPALSEDAFPASFGHLINGYDAGYYGYMLSKTYALDMFASEFEKDPLSPEKGAKYRKCILEPGGSGDGIDYIRKFLGHEPTLDAFLSRCGFETQSNQPLQAVAESKQEKVLLSPPPLLRS